MLLDAYENPVSTTSISACDAYNRGVHRFLGAEPSVEESFQLAIDEDPKFALAYIGLAREMQIRGRPDDVRTSLGNARELNENLSEREKSHIHISTFLLEGKSAKARAAVYKHVTHWLKDVLIAQMCTSVFGLIGFSGLPGREAEQLAFVSGLASHYGDNWWFRAQLAFAQLEVGQLETAAVNIEAALDGNPDSAHSKHVRAHLYYENMEDEEGLRYLEHHWKNYDPSGSLYNHISWHVGLWSLETGNLDQMWRVLDSDINPKNSQGPPLNILTDSAALLFRAELAGVEVPPERWQTLSSYALAKFAKPGLGFADVHAAIIHTRSGNIEALNTIIEGARGPAAELTKALAKGYREMENRNWSKAATLFASTIPSHARLGGSKAQRDLIDFSLAACLIRDGRRAEARTALSITRPKAVQKDLIAGI